MKKAILLFCAVIVTGVAEAQSATNTIQSGVYKKGKTVWVVKPMQDNETMDNGLTVNPNGNVKTSSGKSVLLGDGDCIGTDGRMVGLNEKDIKTALVKQGKMWVATRVDETMTLSDGTTVMPNGTIKKKDGTIVPIKNDEIIPVSDTGADL
jgi:hypothetical protein